MIAFTADVFVCVEAVGTFVVEKKLNAYNLSINNM